MAQVLELSEADIPIEAAARIGDALAAACAEPSQGRIGFMVSGGRTPAQVLPLVLGRDDVDWARVDVVASDERLVSRDYPASTEGLVRLLFEKAGRVCHYVGFGADTSPDMALAQWQAGIERMAWPPVIAFLGMGDDAHIASLFPRRPEAARADLFVASVPETAPHVAPRLTLGAKALSDCETLLLVANSAGKAAQLERALLPNSDPSELPVVWLTRMAQTTVLKIRKETG